MLTICSSLSIGYFTQPSTIKIFRTLELISVPIEKIVELFKTFETCHCRLILVIAAMKYLAIWSLRQYICLLLVSIHVIQLSALMLMPF